MKAPEVVTRIGHSYGVDFYALGALLHELICGLPPFYSENPDEMMDNIITKQLIIPNDISESLRDLIHKLVNRNMEKFIFFNLFFQRRLHSFDELKKHKWLQDCDWENICNKSIVSPLAIDFNSSNIHEEFLEIDIYPEKF